MDPMHFRKYLATDEAQQGADYVRRLANGPLDVFVVLGSGLAEVLAPWGDPLAHCALSDIPGVIAPVADGHEDRFLVYRRPVAVGPGSVTVGVACGRTHLYEGHGPDAVTHLSKVVALAGAGVAIVCNSNGCLRDWDLGDVVAIEDHANLSGTSPFSGTVFLDVATVWDDEFTDVLTQHVQRRGNYAMLRGPEYQTRLESRMLRAAGVDCVGMSTVLEAITLHAFGVRVCGLSVVSDLSFAVAPTDPGAVLEAAAAAQPVVRRGIEAVLAAVSP